jgi:hypothetical protein
MPGSTMVLPEKPAARMTWYLARNVKEVVTNIILKFVQPKFKND